jgi:hypothetical protein
MTTATMPRNGYPAVAPGVRLLGEVIAWGCPGVKVRHKDLVAALREAGLDESAARGLAPRHAFARACRQLSERRIIRQVGEDARSIWFQFTSEQLEEGRFRYDLEAVLSLEKATGAVSCDLPQLAALAQARLDDCLSCRNGGDVTRMLQRLFERNADLFPIRDKGGCYFCPAEHSGFLDRIDRFVAGLGGVLRRFPVSAGTAQGDRSVKEAVASGIASLIEEHRAAVAAFGSDTREATLERAAERIRLVRHKVSCYAAYLQGEHERLEQDLHDAARELREKVESLGSEATPCTTSSVPS